MDNSSVRLFNFDYVSSQGYTDGQQVVLAGLYATAYTFYDICRKFSVNEENITKEQFTEHSLARIELLTRMWENILYFWDSLPYSKKNSIHRAVLVFWSNHITEAHEFLQENGIDLLKIGDILSDMTENIDTRICIAEAIRNKVELNILNNFIADQNIEVEGEAALLTEQDKKLQRATAVIGLFRPAKSPGIWWPIRQPAQ